MTIATEIALASLFLMFLAQLVATVWWAATVNAKVADLGKRAEEHGNVRDLVIEMRAEMKEFRGAITTLTESLKEVRRGGRSSSP